MDNKNNDLPEDFSPQKPLSILADTAKKVLLSSGIMFFALLSAMFLSIAGNYADYDFHSWLLAVFFASGPALISVVMGMALMKKKSKNC